MQLQQDCQTFKSLQGSVSVYVKGGDQNNFTLVTETRDAQKELAYKVLSDNTNYSYVLNFYELKIK